MRTRSDGEALDAAADRDRFLGQLELLEMLDRWVIEHDETLSAFALRPVDGLSDRESEIAWPLLAIAHVFGMEDYIAKSIVAMINEYHERALKALHDTEISEEGRAGLTALAEAAVRREF